MREPKIRLGQETLIPLSANYQATYTETTSPAPGSRKTTEVVAVQNRDGEMCFLLRTRFVDGDILVWAENRDDGLYTSERNPEDINLKYEFPAKDKSWKHTTYEDDNKLVWDVSCTATNADVTADGVLYHGCIQYTSTLGIESKVMEYFHVGIGLVVSENYTKGANDQWKLDSRWELVSGSSKVKTTGSGQT